MDWFIASNFENNAVLFTILKRQTILPFQLVRIDDGGSGSGGDNDDKDREMMETQVEKMVNETLEELNSNISIELSLSLPLEFRFQ